MIMKKTITLLGILLLLSISILLLLYSCGSSVTGRYVNKDNSREYLELKSDGTFYCKESFMGFSGRYKVEDDMIILRLEGGITARGRIRGNRIIDDDGKIWVKQ